MVGVEPEFAVPQLDTSDEKPMPELPSHIELQFTVFNPTRVIKTPPEASELITCDELIKVAGLFSRFFLHMVNSRPDPSTLPLAWYRTISIMSAFAIPETNRCASRSLNSPEHSSCCPCF